MLPFLVLQLIALVVLMPIVFIGGIMAAVNNWELGLITLVIGSAFVGKYYYSSCHQGVRVDRSQYSESKF